MYRFNFIKLFGRLDIARWSLTRWDTDPARSLFQPSFSQGGEDVLIRQIFIARGIAQPSYADIGAHHPMKCSNTMLFYLTGSRGMNIEPHPQLIEAFRRERPEDININIGIGPVETMLPFYEMSDTMLSTFDKEEAERLQKEEGIPLSKIHNVSVRPLCNVFRANHFSPDFISLDVEGYDEIILKSYDWSYARPKVICVETLTFSTTGHGSKKDSLISFLDQKNYAIYADTHINTIFVDKTW